MDATRSRRIAEAAAALRAGAVIAYPTETFYGLGALAVDGAAVERLARAKGRPDGKPLPLLAADLAQVEAVAVLSPLARRLAGACWPGPLTLVLPARPGLHPLLTGGGATVGVRVTGGEVAAALALAAGGALVSTSANLAGAPPAASPADLDPALVARLDLVLDCGPAPGGLPSTVVVVEGVRLRLLRPGAVAAAHLEAVAGVSLE
ncbi:MAG: threonylcarbamoyl-AMP synthase [Anaeromyxobacter sp.]|nr:threonylcarbamoyl-AMP synthase [Anaeromyxobacter sp.]